MLLPDKEMSFKKKKTLFLDKKGVTPLIATFLLISFAVALGVVIMTFGKAQVESEAECPLEINLKLSIISGEEQFCYDAAERDLSFTVENGVNVNVDGLIVNVISAQKAETFELNEARMGKAGVYLGHLPYDSSAGGEIRQVKISPRIILHENVEICADKAIIVEEIKNCR